jgi:hypothetical protein
MPELPGAVVLPLPVPMPLPELPVAPVLPLP